MKKKILKNRELLLGGRHLTFCVDIRVCLCYTIIVPKGTEREEEKMKEYTVEVAMSAWAKVIVIAQDEEEAVAKAYNVVEIHSLVSHDGGGIRHL